MSGLDLLRETLADYGRVRDALTGLPDLALVSVRRDRGPAPVDRALFERVVAALESPGTLGWARFRSELGMTGWPRPDFAEAGSPSAAEWIDRDRVSHRLTPAPGASGQGLIVSITEGDPAADNGALVCLRQTIAVLAHHRAAPYTHAAYDVYWGLPEDGGTSGMRRLFDRFAGFESRES